MTHEVLSIREAARRVHRSRRTIQYWLRGGMPHHERPGDRTKWIHLDDLQATLRQKLRARRAHDATGSTGRFGQQPEPPEP